MRFSKTTGCFYPNSINYSTLPADIVDVIDSYYEIASTRNLGDTLDVIDGKVVIVPKPAKTLEKLKSDKQSEIKTSASTAIVSGIASSVLGTAHNYPTTIIDQQNLNGLITESLLPISGDEYKFWCADELGVWARRIHTKTQIQALGLEFSAHVKSQQAKYEQKLLAIDNVTNSTELDSITWN